MRTTRLYVSIFQTTKQSLSVYKETSFFLKAKTDCLVSKTKAVCWESILEFKTIKEDIHQRRKALLKDNAHLYLVARLR